MAIDSNFYVNNSIHIFNKFLNIHIFNKFLVLKLLYDFFWNIIIEIRFND